MGLLSDSIINTEYPFLSEEEDTKIITLICNYLSLGQFELARALILQTTQKQNNSNNGSKISSILYHTIRNGPPSTWLTSDSIPSSPHLSWLCSIEFHQLNKDGFTSSISEKTLLLIEFAILIYTTLGEQQNNDSRNIQPIIQELREYHYVLLSQQQQQTTSQQSQQLNIDSLSDSQINQMSSILGKSKLGNSTISTLRNILLNNSDFGRYIINHFTNPFISLNDNSYSLLQSRYPVTQQLEYLISEVISLLIDNSQYSEAYNLLSIIDISNQSQQQQQQSSSTTPPTNNPISKLLEKVASLNNCSTNITNNNVEELTLLKIPFSSSSSSPNNNNNNNDTTTKTSMSRLKIYESLLSNKTLDPLKVYLNHEDSALLEKQQNNTVLDVPECFEILKNYFSLKPKQQQQQQQDSNPSGGSKFTNIKTNLKSFDREDKEYQNAENIFWYWYYHFLRVNDKHYLEYALEKSIELVKNKRFEDALIVIKPFEKLLPLLVLICWDHFENDITSRKHLTNLLDLSKGINNDNQNLDCNNQDEEINNEELEKDKDGEREVDSKSNTTSKVYKNDERFDPILLHANHQLSYLIELAEFCCRRMIAVPNSPNGHSLIIGDKTFDLQNEKSKTLRGGNGNIRSSITFGSGGSSSGGENGENSPGSSSSSSPFLYSLGRSMTTDISNAILSQLFHHSFIYVIKDCLPFITSSDILKFIEKDPDFQNIDSGSGDSMLSQIALDKLNDMNLIRGYYLIKNVLKFFQYRATSDNGISGSGGEVDQSEFDNVLDDVFDLFKGISNSNISIGLIESLYLSLFLSNQDLKPNKLSRSSSNLELDLNSSINNYNGGGGKSTINNNNIGEIDEINSYYKKIITGDSSTTGIEIDNQLSSNVQNSDNQIIGIIDNEYNYQKQSKSTHRNYFIKCTMLESLIDKLKIIIQHIVNSFGQQQQESDKERIQILISNLENLKQRVDLSKWILNSNVDYHQEDECNNSNYHGYNHIPFMSLVLMPIKSLLLMAMRTNYPNFQIVQQYFNVPKDIENQVYQFKSIPNLIEIIETTTNTDTFELEDHNGDGDEDKLKGINNDNIFQILCDIVIGSNCKDSLITKVINTSAKFNNNNNNKNKNSYINWVTELHGEYIDQLSTSTTLYDIMINPQSIPDKGYRNVDKMKQYINNRKLIIQSLNRLIKCYDDSLNQQDDHFKIIIENDISSTKILSTTFKYILSINQIYGNTNNGSIFKNLNQSPKSILKDIVFNEKHYEKAEQLSNKLEIDLSDLIISSISHTTPKNPPPSLFKSTTPETTVLNSPIYYVNQDQQQQQQQSSQQSSPPQLPTNNNIDSTTNTQLTMDLVYYFEKSSKLLSSLICMLKSPDQSDIEPFLKYSIESSKQLSSNSLSNWINEILKAHTFYYKYLNIDNNGSNGGGQSSLDSESSFDYRLIQNSESIHQQQNFFFKIIQHFVNSGNLFDALKIADEYLEEGAPDWLLKLLVFKDRSQGYKYIRRMRDKAKALNLVMELYSNWDIATCIDMIVICKSFINSGSGNNNGESNNNNLNTLNELEYLHQSFLLYQAITLKSNDQFSNASWQEIKEICIKDPASMVRSLLDKQHYELARKIRDHFKVSNVKKEIEERYLYYLLVEKDDASLALQTLSELGQESIGILDSLLPIIKEISVKLFLVQFLLSNMRDNLSSDKLNLLVQQEIGYQVLLVLPDDLQKEYLEFVCHPNLIIEMLIMNEKIPLVSKLLNEIKELKQVDDLLVYYARKALSFNRYLAKNDLMMLDDYLQREFKDSDSSAPSTPVIKQLSTPSSSAPSTPSKSSQRKSFLSSLPLINNNYVGGGGGNGNSNNGSGGGSNSGSGKYGNALKSSDSFDIEDLRMLSEEISATTIIEVSQPSSNILQLKDTNGKIQQKWVLSGVDSVIDEQVRHNHFFSRSPSISLAKSLFDLCESKKIVYNTCIELYSNLSRLLSSNYSDDNLLIINLIQQLLMYTKLQLLRDPKSGGPTLVAVCDTYLGKVELFQSLVISKCSGSMSLVDLSDPQKARQLRDRLIQEDRLRLAIDVATKCNIPADSAWVSWGISLIQTGSYQEAREKFKYCLTPTGPDRRVMSPSNSISIDTIDSGVILNQIIQLLESPPSPNHSNFRNLYNYLVSTLGGNNSTSNFNLKSSTKIDDSLFYSLLQPQSQQSSNNSTTSILSSSSGGGSISGSSPSTSVLNNSISNLFSNAFNSDKKSSSSGGNSNTGGSGGNAFINSIEIDKGRLDEAIYYLKKYGSGRMLVNFLIKHNLYELACKTILSDGLTYNIFFDEVVSRAISNSSLQELFNTIKSIDPKLLQFQEHLLASCKIMNERKQYQLLFEFQLYMGDNVRAGLTCVKMFLTNPEGTANSRIHHLEQALYYFNIGLSNFGKNQSNNSILSEIDIDKYIQNTSTQLEISKFFYKQQSIPTTSNIHKLSIFGTTKQRTDLVEQLTIYCNFELGFKIAQESKLSLAPIYTSALITMARKKMVGKIEEYLNTLRNYIDPDDWESIAMPVFEILALELRDFKTPEKFIPKLYSVHNSVRVSIICGKLKTAYLTAVQHKDRSLIKMVMDEAQKTNQPIIFKWCQEILNQ